MSDRRVQHSCTAGHRGKSLAFRRLLPIVCAILAVVAACYLWNGVAKNDTTATASPSVEALSNNMVILGPQEGISPEGILKNPAEDGDWNLTLVNKWNAAPEDWEMNLVELDGGERVDERIYEPLMEMLEAAKEGNWDQLPMVVSGYRTEDKQQKLYNEKIEEYEQEGYARSEAKELAAQWVSLPGYSEHHLGFAVDINGATYDVYFWLQENSYKYGFIFRYPGSKTEITGVAEEVWHYRYVGVEAATEIYERGICLEEYLESMSR